MMHIAALVFVEDRFAAIVDATDDDWIFLGPCPSASADMAVPWSFKHLISQDSFYMAALLAASKSRASLAK